MAWTRAQLDAYAEAYAEGLNLLTADGFDDCILGVCQRFNHTFVVYDRAQVIETLMTRDGMTGEDAEAWFDFNIVGAWVGEATPGYVQTEPDE